MTSLLDLLPTVLSIVGQPAPNIHIDGHSLLPALTEAKEKDMDHEMERTVYHFCDSEIFSSRRQMKDGKIYKMILQEPELTQSGGCSGESAALQAFCWISLFSCLNI